MNTVPWSAVHDDEDLDSLLTLKDVRDWMDTSEMPVCPLPLELANKVRTVVASGLIRKNLRNLGKEGKPMITHKGVYYFASVELAKDYAEKNGYPTNRIIHYGLGWAIQGGNGGDYAGPHGLKIGDWPNLRTVKTQSVRR